MPPSPVLMLRSLCLTAVLLLAGLPLADAQVAPPQATLSATSLTFTIAPGQTTAEQPLVLANEAEEGADGLSFVAFTRKSGADGLLGNGGGGDAILTQSLSQDLTNGFASVCNLQTTTSYWRLFDLAQTDLTGEFVVSTVEIGIAAAPAVETTLRLYRVDGSLQFGTRTLLAEVAVPLDTLSAPLLLPVPVTASIDTDALLAVEWNTPYVPDEGPFLGSNLSGQTRAHYQSYPGCFSTDLPPLLSPSADRNWVLNVVGTAGPAPFTVSPGSGVVSAGTSSTLTVAVDAAALEEGVHPYEVIVLTNDSDAPSFAVAVNVDVQARVVAAETDAARSALTLRTVGPSPARGAMRIALDLPDAADVRLDVFDVAGRRVASLLDARLAAGTHEVGWEATGHAAGTYLLRAQARGESRTLLLTLAR